MANKQDKERKHRASKQIKRRRTKAPRSNGVHGYAHKNVPMPYTNHIK